MQKDTLCAELIDGLMGFKIRPQQVQLYSRTRPQLFQRRRQPLRKEQLLQEISTLLEKEGFIISSVKATTPTYDVNPTVPRLQPAEKPFRAKPQSQSLVQSVSRQPLRRKYPLHLERAAASLRYHKVQLLQLIGRKDCFLDLIAGKEQQSILRRPSQKEIDEVCAKIVKALPVKGRFRCRDKFNPMFSPQLKAIKCPFPKRKHQKYDYKKVLNRDDEENEDKAVEEYEEQKYKDFSSWKRQHQVDQKAKVFIIKGGYEDLRRALVGRGWVQNPDVFSPYFDLKWTCKQIDIRFQDLNDGQIVNHFANNQGLVSKFGLAKNLRALAYLEGIDSDLFFPRCFDLGDLSDFQDFIQDFKFTFAQTVLKRFLYDPNRYLAFQTKVRLALAIIKRRNIALQNQIESAFLNQFVFINAEEWMVLTQNPELLEKTLLDKLKELKKPFEQEEAEFKTSQCGLERWQQFMKDKIEGELKRQIQIDPQFKMNGFRNVWIVKPNFLSRGRGIRCFNNLFDIVDYSCFKEVQFVAQKYIQNPWLVMGKKFDIRQWVLIQGFQPPKVWFYKKCYFRFCAEQYSIQDIRNRFVHLTNNSVNKYSSKFANSAIQHNMWGEEDFVPFFEKEWGSSFQIIRDKMKEIVTATVMACRGTISSRRNTFQLVGYDFMVDQSLNVWLIECNSSPSLEYSTPVTKKLVKELMEDVVKVIVDKKGERGFTLIHQGEKPKLKYYAVSAQQPQRLSG